MKTARTHNETVTSKQ